jgi:photosystem II stability/assembly factor-like uncharacterized protein
MTGTAALSGLQFVSPAQGWAVGQNVILATLDGGAHWQAQLSGQLNLTSADFISARDGWAVGTDRLLVTTDGGARWSSLPEPCPVIRSVHFISPVVGYAVAGNDGIVLATANGGHSWVTQSAPAGAQSVCFSDARHGWLGASGLLYRTTDGGRSWVKLTGTGGEDGSGTAEMTVECAAGGNAWALRIGPGAGMSQEPHVGYHADAAGATALFAEQYFQSPGATPTAQAPSAYAGPYSAISATTAVFADWCDACGYGTVPFYLVTHSGATVAKGAVAKINDPGAASFTSAETGWVAGSVTVQNAKNQTRSQQRIVATADGGRTWRIVYATPWTKWA